MKKRTTSNQHQTQPHLRHPDWLKIRPKSGAEFNRVRQILKENSLHSVCQEAACPNISECFGEGTATFIILGDKCSRNCAFCDVTSGDQKGLVDVDEPRRLAEGVTKLKLKQVVITSVTRDDLPDGGASVFAAVKNELTQRDCHVKVEFLIPDFEGKPDSLEMVLNSAPDVLSHNVETVGRLQKPIRGKARLDRSLTVLKMIAAHKSHPVVKTGIMVGMGETQDEVVELMYQCYAAGAQIFTIGQYLRPSINHLPIERYYTPEEFVNLSQIGKKIGFVHVESGPLVRSSYKAFNQSKDLI